MKVFSRAQLQGAVDQRGDVADIVEEVVHPFLRDVRYHRLVGAHHRQEDIFVEAVVEAVHGPVEPLPGIRNLIGDVGGARDQHILRREIGFLDDIALLDGSRAAGAQQEARQPVSVRYCVRFL